MINIIDGGVTAVKGFMAASVYAGLKENRSVDMAMIASRVPCIAAGCFTKNTMKGAPILWNQERMKERSAIHVIVANAGIANACAGEDGLVLCHRMAETVAGRLLISPESVLLASTGKLGVAIPKEKILAGTEELCEHLESSIAAGTMAARAVMTGDKREKQVAVNFTLADGTIATVGAFAKGSAMLQPNMCTLLVFITTNLAISRELLSEALTEDVRETYNMICVDGDTSPNDEVILLANGLAGNAVIRERNADYQMFKEVLHEVNIALARQIAADTDGALLMCQVVHAPDKEAARAVAKTAASSCGVRRMLAARELYWGRILSTIGQSGVAVEQGQIDLTIESRSGSLRCLSRGEDTGFDRREAAKILGEAEIRLIIDLGSGAGEATACGCTDSALQTGLK